MPIEGAEVGLVDTLDVSYGETVGVELPLGVGALEMDMVTGLSTDVLAAVEYREASKGGPDRGRLRRASRVYAAGRVSPVRLGTASGRGVGGVLLWLVAH